ncbi:MAG TPA: hypothetical protein PLU14_03790, partial [Caldisericia bacterium]|nr:hypothetical protein [Caldisericia bacterium]
KITAIISIGNSSLAYALYYQPPSRFEFLFRLLMIQFTPLTRFLISLYLQCMILFVVIKIKRYFSIPIIGCDSSN